MFKRNWVVYAITHDQINGLEAHVITMDSTKKKQAIDAMYEKLKSYSFRNIMVVQAKRN